jgi:hypothetical protein
VVNALVASIALLAAPPVGTANESFAEGDPFSGPPSLSLWVQPLGTAFLLATGQGLYLPIGANIRTSESFDVQLELALLAGTFDGGGEEPAISSRGAAFSVGPLFRKRAFFLSPKILCAVQRDRQQGTDADGLAFDHEGTAVIGHLGADIGMEMRAGGLMLGFSTGASAGVCRGCGSTMFYSPFGFGGGALAQGGKSFTPSFGVNLNLLRIGAAF